MNDISEQLAQDVPNGSAAAAILAAGIGSFAVGALALAADAFSTINHALTFSKPVGALSGVTTLAVLAWLVAWVALARRWGGTQVRIDWINAAAFALLGLGLVLTFPPAMDFLQGK
jgi:hypothetical protein